MVSLLKCPPSHLGPDMIAKLIRTKKQGLNTKHPQTMVAIINNESAISCQQNHLLEWTAGSAAEARRRGQVGVDWGGLKCIVQAKSLSLSLSNLPWEYRDFVTLLILGLGG